MQRVFDVSAHITGYKFDTKFGTRPSRIDIDGRTYHLTDPGIVISIGKGKRARRIISYDVGMYNINFCACSDGWSITRLY